MASGRAAAAVVLGGLLALSAACGGEDASGEAGGSSAVEDSPAARSTPDGQARPEGEAEERPAERGEAGRRLTTIDVAGHRVSVEIADDDSERRRGLMHRDSLPENQGMLFVYPEQQTLSFWMRETELPLDIAFIDRRGYIVDIQQMDPHTEELHESSSPAMYALEMNRGWFGEHEVEEGDRVRF